MSGWIGVDLDGTLATYEEWRGLEHIGDPVPAMKERGGALAFRGQGRSDLHSAGVTSQ